MEMRGYKHGMAYTRFYGIWLAMRKRCLKHPLYIKNKIKVCSSWLTFDNFFKDMFESYNICCEKEGVSRTSIDRINNSLGYNKKNCRWANPTQQRLNCSRIHYLTYKGETLPLKLMAEKYGYAETCLRQRINILKWPIEKALTQKSKQRTICKK